MSKVYRKQSKFEIKISKSLQVFNFNFSEKFSITSNDVIYASAPQTFDPFMIDLMLTLTNGATLITVDPILRLQPNALLGALFSSENDIQCTVMQITPSLFLRWTAEDMNRIFSSSSPLRILAFGGEPFPSSDLTPCIQWLNSNESRHLYNLYGLTEISCWLSLHDVSAAEIKENKIIPIGEPLDEHTKFDFLPNGELVARTRVRKCFQDAVKDADVLDDSKEIAFQTSDLFMKSSNNAMCFKGRSNNIVKILGRKVDLNHLESLAKSACDKCEVVCVLNESNNFVIFFVQTANSNVGEIQKNISNKLNENEIDVIHKVHRINQFPLSLHGKISKKSLLRIYKSETEQTEEGHRQILAEIFNVVLNTKIESIDKERGTELNKRPRQEIDSSFIALGGTSLKALNVINHLQDKVNFIPPTLLSMLLNDKIPLREVIKQFKETVERIAMKSDESDAKDISQNIQMKLNWSLDMKKCVDAKPTLISSRIGWIVSIGSHSGLLLNISFDNGHLISSLSLPDRIESQVTDCGNDLASVGCYDGKIYCFNYLSGEFKWSTDTEGMIKCRPLFMNSTIIIGNYNSMRNIFAVNSDDGRIIWTQKIGQKSIYSNPLQMGPDDFIVCSLDGTVASLSSSTGEIQWTKKLETPIFATPMLIKKHEKQFLIVVTVDGKLTCFDESQNCVWNYIINGNIFCTPLYRINEHIIEFVVGSQNCFLYCLHFDIKDNIITDKWKFKTDSSIRSTSSEIVIESFERIVSFSSKGNVFINSWMDGALLNTFKINGEIFSTPKIHQNSIVVGSRNNFIYCLDMNEYK